MIDVSKSMIEELNKILPTYLDQYVDSNASVPCITYFLYNNTQEETGNTLGYSEVTHCVKLWDHSVSNISLYGESIDKTMRKLGYRRISVNDQLNEDLICRVFLYRGLCRETFEYKGE